MKYTTEISIDVPIEKVLHLLTGPEHMEHWQRGLTDYALLSGIQGEEGALTELKYTLGKRKMRLVETIIKKNLPGELHLTYDTKGVHNIQKNFFEREGDSRTRWKSDSEFQFSGFMMKLMGWMMPGAFKKQSLQYMTDFKNYAEKGISVKTEANTE